MQHPELGRRILDRVAEEVTEVGKVEVMPKQDGRNMTMVLAPEKKVVPKKPSESKPHAGDDDLTSPQAPPTEVVAEPAAVPDTESIVEVEKTIEPATAAAAEPETAPRRPTTPAAAKATMPL